MSLFQPFKSNWCSQGSIDEGLGVEWLRGSFGGRFFRKKLQVGVGRWVGQIWSSLDMLGILEFWKVLREGSRVGITRRRFTVGSLEENEGVLSEGSRVGIAKSRFDGCCFRELEPTRGGWWGDRIWRECPTDSMISALAEQESGLDGQPLDNI
ncbi:hypothetical protein ACFE04_020927 [Oxalis oulophora]